MVVLGIDVAKLKLDAALYLPERRQWYACKLPNDSVGVAKLLAWAAHKSDVAPAAFGVTLEATGVYHELAAEQFHDAGCRVVVVNPKRAHDFARGIGILTKTDRVDARALARYGTQEGLSQWMPPAPEVRALRALRARFAAVENDLRRELNRQEKIQVSATPAAVRDSLKRSILTLKQERKRLQKAVEDHYDQHPGLKAQRHLLQSIPCVGPVSADHLLCLLKTHHFHTARQAAALCGLVPVEHQSGTSIHGRPHLSKQGNGKLRAVLYMASVVALRYNPQLRAIYDRLVARGKAKRAALGALMRHLVHIAFGVLKHQQPYNPALVSKMI